MGNASSSASSNASSNSKHGISSPSFVLQRKAGADEKYKRVSRWNDDEDADNVDSHELASRPIQWDDASSVAAHSRINLLENNIMHVHLIGAGDAKAQEGAKKKSRLGRRLRCWGGRPSSAAPTKSRSEKRTGGKASNVWFAHAIHTDIYPAEPEVSEDEIDVRDEIPRAPPPSSAQRIASVKKGRVGGRVGGVVLSGPRKSSDDSSLFMGTARPLVRQNTFPRAGVPAAASSETSCAAGMVAAEGGGRRSNQDIGIGEQVQGLCAGVAKLDSVSPRQGDGVGAHDSEVVDASPRQVCAANRRAAAEDVVSPPPPPRALADKYFAAGPPTWSKYNRDSCPCTSSDSEASAAGTEERFKRMSSGGGAYDGASNEACTESDWSTHGSLTTEDWSTHGFPLDEAKEVAGALLARTPLAPLAPQHATSAPGGTAPKPFEAVATVSQPISHQKRGFE